MNSFYIYSYSYREDDDGIEKEISATVIFCSSVEIDEGDLRTEIKHFYQQHYQTDRIFIIGPGIDNKKLHDVFIKNQDATFKGIPKRQETAVAEGINVLSFDKDGQITRIHGQSNLLVFQNTYLNEGLQQIFFKRGGLIVSEGTHHYVFPSGKHCNQFLRTGNILIYSSEIFFIAFALLKHFDENKYARIFCDTSSINSIAFALFDLKNSFLAEKRKVSIESFSSYSGLFHNPQEYSKDSFLLISASTSTNILKYILNSQTVIDRDNILVLYFLAAGSADYANVKDQVLCNLTKSDDNPSGIPSYPTYLEPNCKLCDGGSYPVPVSGDVFLLEAPKVNKILFTKADRENNLSSFVNEFRSVEHKQTILKAHYKERGESKYEVYIDFATIISHVRGNEYCKAYKNKLNSYIQQYIPSNTKYLLHLLDDGSRELTQYIYDYIAPSYNSEALPVILDQDQLEDIDPTQTGAIVVIGSCVSNGKNLLYISRALRKFNKLRIIYFVGIVRTGGLKYTSTLVGNLTMGQYGASTHGFFTVSTLYCNNNSKQSPWMQELEFLKEMLSNITISASTNQTAFSFFQQRKNSINKASGDEQKGLSANLFYPRVTTTNPEPLELRKGFVFWDFSEYQDHVVQSETFFTISNILNSLRNSVDPDKQLKQSVYVRNLIDPANFNRFNDGIIQASVLRAARAEELSYSMDSEVSKEMFNILETIIVYHKQQQGEALLEFLYAIATKKMTLTDTDLRGVLLLITEKCEHELFLCFRDYIKKKLIDEPEEIRNKPLPAKDLP